MFSTLKNIAKHSVIYGLGDLLSRSIGFILIPLYTHYLSTEEYGSLELFTLVTHILGFVIALGISQAVVRFYFEYERQVDRDRVVSVALVSVWAMSAVSLAILYILSPQFSFLVFEHYDYANLFCIVFTTLVITLANEIPLDLLRIQERSVQYSSLMLCRVALTLSLNIFFVVFLGYGVLGILLSALISNSVLGIYLLIDVLKKISLSFSWGLLRQMLGYSYPLMASWFGGFLLHFCDRFFLQRMTSLSQVGIYALSYKFGYLLNILLLTPFRKTWNPKQFEVAKQSDAKSIFSAVCTYYFTIQIFLTLGISLVIEDAITILANAEYRESAQYVPLLLIAYNFYGGFSFFQFAMHYCKKTHYLAGITLTAGLVNLGINYFMIPTHGAWGAVLATLISFVLLFILTFVIAQRLYRIPIELKRLSIALCSGVVLYLAGNLLQLSTPLISMCIKGGIACTMPILLYFLGFYQSREIEKMKDMVEHMLKRIGR